MNPGTIVKQSKESEFYKQSEEMPGIIIEEHPPGWYVVKWLNGNRNSYPKEILIILKGADHINLFNIKNL